MESNAEKLLKDVVAQVEGKDPGEVHFKDLRIKKKRKMVLESPVSPVEGQCVDSGEGLVLTGAGSKIEHWDQIRKKKTHVVKSNLEEWGAFDFFYFTQDIYRKRYGEEWNLRVGGCSVEINRIRDMLLDLCGFTSNLMMRDYILYFVERHMDYFKRRGGFYFSQMKHDDILSRFVDNYDYRASFTAYMSHEKGHASPESRITATEVENSYALGSTTLLCNYGLVIALNWLLLNKAMDRRQAVALILKTCRILQQRGILDVVKDVTESYSPYPSWLPFQKPQAILSRVDPQQTVVAEFKPIISKKFIFLRKKLAKEIQWEDSIE